MQRATTPQTWTLTLPGFTLGTNVGLIDQQLQLIGRQPGGYLAGDGSITLQRPPISAITTIKYNQLSDGALTTLAASEYTLAAGNEYTASVAPAYGKTWPSTRSQVEAVQIAFVTGYATAAAVPEGIKAWIKLRVGALYQNRQAWTLGKAIEANPFIDRLLDRYVALTC